MSENILKNTYFSTINIYFEYLLGLVISILIARSLGPNEFGIYSYLVKIAGISIILTNAGISMGAIKFVAEARATGRLDQLAPIYHYFARVQRLKTAVIVSIIGLVFWLSPELLVENEYSWLVAALVLAVVFKSAHMFRVGVFKGFERFDFLAFTVLFVAPLNLVLAISCYYLGYGLFEFFSLFALICFVYWCTSSFFLAKIRKSNFERGIKLDVQLQNRMKHHLKIVTLNTIIGGLVIGQVEVLLLKHLASNEAVAFFNIATVIAGAALLLVPGVYSAVLFPLIARSVADVKSDPAVKIKESIRYLFLLGVMVAMPTYYYGESIIVFLYGEAYAEAGMILGLLTLVGVLNAFREPLNAYLMSIDRQSLLLKISIFAFALSMTCNFVFISLWGLSGAVMAYSLITGSLAVVMMIVAWRYLQIKPDFRKFAIVIVASLIAVTVSGSLTASLDGILQIVVGFTIFGVVYLVLLLFLNAFTERDYDMIQGLAHKAGGVVSKLVSLLISARIHL